jgi:hypothetical protein
MIPYLDDEQLRIPSLLVNGKNFAYEEFGKELPKEYETVPKINIKLSSRAS